ncbi:MAG TPA: XrtA/PEP-CTERM system histidine kinase PrsK [Rhizomicrobium sp.]|jgi:putative PEP-CTERM system histidine kinase|nr:XrtA/PEP-CTERM system histidine kinase PrsK [Rhizomicrobium sp.]
MLFAVSYGIGAAAFIALIALMLINRRPREFGLRVFVASAATAGWAVAAAVQPWWMPGAAHALENVRSGSWLVLLASILSTARRKQDEVRGAAWLPIVAAAIGLASVANDCRFFFSAASPVAFAPSQILDRVVVSVCGILMVENLYRNTSPGRRWNVVPLCIGIGAMFAYDLYVFCEAVVLREVSPSLLAGRGIVLALIVPLLVLTMARNPGWKIDIHVSRRVVFHGATLTAAGVFLLVAAGVAGLIGRFPGQWASISEIGFFCGSIILLLTVLSTESFRSRVRRLIAENFFSTRYDYRTEWLRTIATLSSAAAGEPLTVRAIRAIADVVDSPGGALWLADGAGEFRPAQVLSMALDMSAVEPASGRFVAAFRGGDQVEDFSRDNGCRPAWADAAAVWLAVPLVKIDRLIGFIVLAPPRAPATLNWESYDLLLAIGQQVAGYLEEEQATRALMESRALIDYSRRFSFVIHDIKNVSGQLALMIANITRFGEQAEFRADMVRGMENAANKLRGLVDRLRPDTPAPEAVQLVNPANAIAEVVGELDRRDTPVRARIGTDAAQVRIVPADLHAVLTHLVTNAMEASAGGDEVVIGLRSERGKAVIEVADKGSGMSADFVRNSLFVPLHSTKLRGHGMGAYQARHLVRAAGGEIEVVSAPGRGTTMRILLPDLGETVEQTMETAAS